MALILVAASVQAATFFGQSSDGHPVSATADFTVVDNNTLEVKLTNTTTTTLDAGELFTGVDFRVSGLTPSLTSATGVLRDVESDGTFTDSGSSSLSWQLVDLGGGMWQLNFNPNAEHAILGPSSGGDYSGANNSITGNPGHNPFAGEMATFVLDVPGIGMASLPSVDVKEFRFGTNLDAGTGTNGNPITPGGGPEAPEPASLALLLLGAGVIGLRRRPKRH